MGADIHAYIEYSSSEGRWRPFARPDLPRDYQMFSLLADVRGSGILYPLRGMPSDAGWAAESDNQMFISDTPYDKYAKPKDAARWVASGSSTYILDAGGKPAWVTHPDWHSHSWLNTQEFGHVLDSYQEEPPISYFATLAAMVALETQDSTTARLVFWFDN